MASETVHWRDQLAEAQANAAKLKEERDAALTQARASEMATYKAQLDLARFRELSTAALFEGIRSQLRVLIREELKKRAKKPVTKSNPRAKARR